MNSAEREQLSALIVTRIERAKADIVALEESAQPIAPDNAIGRLSRMESIVSQGVSKTALVTARQTLAALEAASARSADPGFGLCTDCEQLIPVERLLLMPESGQCVGCAGKQR